MHGLRGKVAVIPGAGGGLGAALADAHGAHRSTYVARRDAMDAALERRESS